MRYKLRTIFGVILFCLVCMYVYAEGKPVDVIAEADKQEYNIGDRVKLTVAMQNAKGYEVSFPDKLKNFGDFSFIEAKSSPYEHEYVMGIYSTGTHVIPPIEVKYKKPADNEWQTISTAQIPIQVRSLLSKDDKDIKDLKSLAKFGVNWYWFIFTIIGMVFVGAIIWYFWRKSAEEVEEEEEEKKSAYEVAYERLKELKQKNLPKQGRIKEYYVILSDIVRHYLEDRFLYRAPEMTTEEFMEQVKKSPEMLKAHIELLEDFLSHCDMVKFAKYGPTPIEMVDSFNSAQRLVDKTKPEEDIEEEGGQ